MLGKHGDYVVPDITLLLKLPESRTQDDPRVASVNFNMNVLSETFNCYLFKGVDPTHYYIMIKMSEERLTEECAKLGLKMKLLNSYNLEAFDMSRKTAYEPFRSRQRQEITLSVLGQSIDVD